MQTHIDNVISATRQLLEDPTKLSTKELLGICHLLLGLLMYLNATSPTKDTNND